MEREEGELVKDIFWFYINGLPVTILIILVVLALRYLFRKQSKRTLNLLWVVLLFRLLVPVSLPAGFSTVPTVSELMGIEASSAQDKSSEQGRKENTGAYDPANSTGKKNDSTENSGAFDDGKVSHSGDGTGKTSKDSITNDNVADSRDSKDDHVVDASGDSTVTNSDINISDDKASADTDAGTPNGTAVSGGGKTAENAEIPDGTGYTGSAKKGGSADTGNIIITIVISIWLAGIAMLGSYSLGRMSQFRKKCRKAVPVKDERNVFCWKNEKDACVTGIFRPRIYLPEKLSGRTHEMVLGHERMHIRRHDNIFLFLYFIALLINWYNPLVWMVYAAVQQDIELACDENMLIDASAERKKEYARALLYLGSGRKTELFGAVSFGKGRLKDRIYQIGEEHKTHKLRTVVMVSLLAVIMVFCSCSKKDDTEDIVEGNSELSTEARDDSDDLVSTELDAEERRKQEEEERRRQEEEEDTTKPALVSEDYFVVENPHIEDECFSLDLREELVGLISCKVERYDDGSFKLEFYHINSREKNNRGQILRVEWMDFRDIYDPEMDDKTSSVYSKTVDRTNTLIFGNLDGIMFDRYYWLWICFFSPGGELGVICPDSEDMGGYCLLQSGSPEMDESCWKEYDRCEVMLKYDLCNGFTAKTMPEDYLSEEYKRMLQNRYDRAVKELADGTVVPDDENSLFKDVSGNAEATWIRRYVEQKTWSNLVDVAWLIKMLEYVDAANYNWDQELPPYQTDGKSDNPEDDRNNGNSTEGTNDAKVKPTLVSEEYFTVDDTDIEDESFLINLHEDLVGLISYKVKKYDDGSFELAFYHINSRNRNNRGLIATVRWMDFDDLYDPKYEDKSSDAYQKYDDRRNTLIFGNIDGPMFDQYYTLWTEFNSPGGEFGVVYSDDDNLGGYCIFQNGDVQFDEDCVEEYLKCEAYLIYDLCHGFTAKILPKDYITDEFREIIYARYDRAVRELADGTVAPDDENSPYSLEPEIEANSLNLYKEHKTRKEYITDEWLADSLERATDCAKQYEEMRRKREEESGN